MDQLDIYSDVICPWCYIGKQHMRAALEMLANDGLRFEVTWRAFQLNPEMPREGVERESYRKAKFGSVIKSRQLDRQVAEAARQAGLPIRHDRMKRTPNTLDAHRLIRWAGPLQDAVVDALFRAYFVDGEDVGDRAVLARIAGEAGLAGAAEFLDSSEGESEVLAEDATARRAGLTGVPTFVLDRHVLFSGAVPPDVFAEALGKARRVIREQALATG